MSASDVPTAAPSAASPSTSSTSSPSILYVPPTSPDPLSQVPSRRPNLSPEQSRKLTLLINHLNGDAFALPSTVKEVRAAQKWRHKNLYKGDKEFNVYVSWSGRPLDGGDPTKIKCLPLDDEEKVFLTSERECEEREDPMSVVHHLALFFPAEEVLPSFSSLPFLVPPCFHSVFCITINLLLLTSCLPPKISSGGYLWCLCSPRPAQLSVNQPLGRSLPAPSISPGPTPTHQHSHRLTPSFVPVLVYSALHHTTLPTTLHSISTITVSKTYSAPPSHSLSRSIPTRRGGLADCPWRRDYSFFLQRLSYPQQPLVRCTTLQTNSPHHLLDDAHAHHSSPQPSPRPTRQRRPISRPSECQRFLRAVKWDLAAAFSRTEETISWRREFEVVKLNEDSSIIDEEARTGKEVILGWDIQQRPCLYMFPWRQNVSRERAEAGGRTQWMVVRDVNLGHSARIYRS